MVSPPALSAPLSDTVASPETALLAEFSVKELPEAHAQRRLPAIAVAMIVDIYFFIKNLQKSKYAKKAWLLPNSNK
jgi:hypothetical protein